MDKYEYKVRSEEIVQLIKEENYEEAAAIADMIDWRRVKSLTMLLKIAALYRINRRHEDSRAILLLAYDRYPSNRNVVSTLCEVCIELSDVVAAIEYYKEFVKMAPRDNGVYTLRYRILEAQEASLEERIQLLEELKKRDYQEEWAYELAYLYHRVGLGTKCVEECDDLILWFGDGPYVIKAMELKMLHAPLTSIQEKNYRFMIGEANGIPTDEAYQQEQNQEYTVEEYPYTEDCREQTSDEIAYSQDYYAEEASGDTQEMYQDAYAYEQSGETEYGYQTQQDERYPEEVPYAGESYREEESEELHPQTNGDAYRDETAVDLSQYNTINLQKVVAESMKELFPDDADIYAENKKEVEQLEFASGKLREEEVSQELEIIEESSTPVEDVAEIKENQIDKMLSGVSEMEPAPNSGAIKKVILPEKISEPKQEVLEEVEVPAVVSYETVKSTEEEVPYRPMTGQMNIEDVLQAWERMKRENEEKRKQEVKNLVKQQTGKMFENFEQAAKSGILAGLDMNSSQTPDFPNYRVETILEEEPEDNIQEPVYSIVEEPVMETEAVEETEYPEVEELSEKSQDINTEEFSQEDIADASDILQEEEIEESEYPEVEELADEPEYDESQDYTEEFYEEDAYMEEEQYRDEEESDIPETDELHEEAEYAETEDYADEYTDETEYAVYDEQSEEDTLKTSEITLNTADISSLPEKIIEATKKETKGVRREEIREFTEEEKEYFEDFAVTKKIRKQIIRVLDEMTLASYTGNVLITGEVGIGKIKLAKDLIRAFKNTDENFSGKVAKITGEQLNLRDMKDVFDKLKNGALIVENANELTKESLYQMATLLNREDFGMIVFMVDTKKGIAKLLDKQSMLADYFNLRIDLVEMDNNALVAYAKSYALALEYSIDELGTLALHTRIANIQSGNHIVTKDEVREIIDEAIYNANRPKLKNLLDVIFAKRYDKNDKIVLKEKDFM